MIAPRTKSPAPKAKDRNASWSTDDVYNLLKAVNEQTLKRIEDRAKGAEDYAKAAYAQIMERTGRLETNFLNQMKQDIQAIKARVGA